MSYWRILPFIALCNALSPIALQIVVPALPAIRAEFDSSVGQVQLILSAYSAAMAVSMLVFGRYSDSIDKRKLLIIGLMIFSVGTLFGFYSSSITELVVARIIQAIGAGAASAVSRAIVADAFKGTDLNRAMSALLTLVVLGPMLAPWLGGLLVDWTGWRALMVSMFAFGVLLLIGTWATVKPDESERTPPARTYWADLQTILGDRRFVCNLWILVAVQTGVYAYIAASPFLFVEGLNMSAANYGLLFVYLVAGFIAGTTLSGFLVGRLGGVRLIEVGSIVFVIGALVYVLVALGDARSLLSLAAPAALLTFTNGLTQSNCAADALKNFDLQRGTAVSVLGFTQIMAGALGFQLAGLLSVTSIETYSVLLAVCAASAVMGVLFLRRTIEAA